MEPEVSDHVNLSEVFQGHTGRHIRHDEILQCGFLLDKMGLGKTV